MKLRTSFCNATALKKDITRFAPLWAVYLVGGLLVLLSALSNGSGGYAAQTLSQTIGIFAPINMIYAVVCAQMLFGDLFKSRLCNALHAMPLRRECWFSTHVISGLLFSLVPHVIAVACMAVTLQEMWYVALIWLLGMTLEYLFFFGLAVFSVFCVGNRVAQTAVYGILNFGALIAYWFVYTVYEPLLYGVAIPFDPFTKFSPVVEMANNSSYVKFEYVRDLTYAMRPEYRGFGPGWGYLTVCAVLGVGLLGLALVLYRKRKLESAGNFMAVRPLEPVFAVVFTLCAGMVFAAFGQLFYGTDYVVYLIVGLILGWFVGQMLLKRTVKVFQWQTFVKLGVLGLAMGASLLITSWDPLGITTWMPEKEDIQYVEVNTGSVIRPSSSTYLKLEDREELQVVLDAHGALIEAGKPEPANRASRKFVFQYTLDNGKKVSRYYEVYNGSPAWKLLQKLYAKPEQILGYTNWEDFVQGAEIWLQGYTLDKICAEYAKKRPETPVDYDAIRLELLEALKKDCTEGTVGEDWGTVFTKDYLFNLELKHKNGWRYLAIYRDAQNTSAWFDKYEDILEMII